jgi:hypothetical protein
LFSAHGRSVGCAKSVAVELVAQRADLSGRAVGEQYGVCANAVVANRRRLAARPEVLQVIEKLGGGAGSLGAESGLSFVLCIAKYKA